MALCWLRWRASSPLLAGDAPPLSVVSRGRCGTWRHRPLFRVAGVVLGHIHLRFACQPWHLWHWAGSGGALGRRWSPVTPCHFAWQSWHSRHLVTCTFISCGRCGTWSHPPSFRVAGVALMALSVALTAPSFTRQLSHTTLSHTICHTPLWSHTIFVIHHLSDTIFHTKLCHTRDKNGSL